MWNIFSGGGVYGVGRYGVPSPPDSGPSIDAARAQARSDATDDRVEHLLLVVDAMWELLSARLDLTLDDLVAKIHEIDSRDGQIDGTRHRVGPSPRTCPGCQAVIPPAMSKCQFCGAFVSTDGMDPFDV